MVVANLHVEPAVAFLLPGASIPLRLWQAKKGSMIGMLELFYSQV